MGNGARPIRIGIIGLGFSGTMVLRHLAAQTTCTYDILAYDTPDMMAKGRAYSTHEPQHFLNVPASNMSAYPDACADFVEWMERCPEKWRRLHPDFTQAHFRPDDFAPRMVYAAYLQDILDGALSLASANGHHVSLIPALVSEVDEQLNITNSDGQIETVDYLILASGHFGQRGLSAGRQQEENGTFLENPWQPEAAQSFWDHFENQRWNAASHIVIMGTGLSCIDMLHSLKNRHFPGRITAVSRNGILPHPHKSGLPCLSASENMENFPKTAQGLHQKILLDIEKAEMQGINWRAFIDSLRPVTNLFWQKLPTAEKSAFIEQHLSWWSSLRHRMSTTSFDMVAKAREDGSLSILAARINSIEPDNNGYRLSLSTAYSHGTQDLHADAVINTCGFSYQLKDDGESLPGHLLAQKLIKASTLGIGLQAGSDGKIGERIYALGPLLFGELLETTAVPELRVQAATLAKSIGRACAALK